MVTPPGKGRASPKQETRLLTVNTVLQRPIKLGSPYIDCFRKRLQKDSLLRRGKDDKSHTVDAAARGRERGRSTRNKKELQKLGKTVVFVSQGIIIGSDRDFLSERINETLDEAYSRSLSRWVTSGLAEKAAQGHSIGRSPFRLPQREITQRAWSSSSHRPKHYACPRGCPQGIFIGQTFV
jgi:hypothetical protein